MKLYFHPGTEHGPGDGRDDRLRQPLAGLHAAGHRLAVRHAVRHRQRAGRLPRPLQRDARRSARSRTRPCSRSGRCSPACRASRRRRRSAAASGPSSSASTPTGCAPTACRPTRSITAPRPPATRSAPRATSASATRCRSCRSTRWSRTSRSCETIPIRPGASPTVYLRDVGHRRGRHRHPDRLRPGQRPAGRLHPRHQAGRRLDARRRQRTSRRTCPTMQAVLPDDIKVSFEFDQSPYVTRAMQSVAIEGAARGGARPA